jgi:selenophosphate synthase
MALVECSPEKYMQMKIMNILKESFSEILIDTQIPEENIQTKVLPMISVREAEVDNVSNYSFDDDKYEFNCAVVLYMPKGKTKAKAESAREESRVLAKQIGEAIRTGWVSDHSLICFDHFMSYSNTTPSTFENLLATGVVIVGQGVHRRDAAFFFEDPAQDNNNEES